MSAVHHLATRYSPEICALQGRPAHDLLLYSRVAASSAILAVSWVPFFLHLLLKYISPPPPSTLRAFHKYDLGDISIFRFEQVFVPRKSGGAIGHISPRSSAEERNSKKREKTYIRPTVSYRKSSLPACLMIYQGVSLEPLGIDTVLNHILLWNIRRISFYYYHWQGE